jgi:hypothetical protein
MCLSDGVFWRTLAFLREVAIHNQLSSAQVETSSFTGVIFFKRHLMQIYDLTKFSDF